MVNVIPTQRYSGTKIEVESKNLSSDALISIAFTSRSIFLISIKIKEHFPSC